MRCIPSKRLELTWQAPSKPLEGGERVEGLPPLVALVVGKERFQASAAGGGVAVSEFCGLTSDGAVHGWLSHGRAYGGADAGGAGQELQAHRVEGLPPIRALAANAGNAEHTCAIDTTGEVLCWGSNATGESGRPWSRSVPPTRITRAEGGALDGVKQVVLGAGWSCALTQEGSVWCWGSMAAYGVKDDHLARRIAGLAGSTALHGGAGWMCATTSAGETRCLGDVSWLSGELPPHAFRPVPFRAPCALAELASAHVAPCWRTSSGEVGCGTAEGEFRPFAAGSLLRVHPKLSLAGFATVCTLTPAQTIRCLGLDWSAGHAQAQPVTATSSSTVAKACTAPSVAPEHVPAFPGRGFRTARLHSLNVESATHCMMPFFVSEQGLERCASLGPGKVVPASALDTLLSTTNDPNTYTPMATGCFDPHHAFVFYDDVDRPVAWLSVCFLCDQLESSPLVPARVMNGRHAFSKAGRAAFATLVTDLGLPPEARPEKSAH